MSNNYFLVCMDCNRGIDLCTIISVRYDDIANECFGFSSLGHSSQTGWTPSVRGCSEAQQFLIIHREHELRVLPDLAARYTEASFPGGFPDEDDGDPRYNRDYFFSQHMDRPDAEREVANFSVELIGRIGELKDD